MSRGTQNETEELNGMDAETSNGTGGLDRPTAAERSSLGRPTDAEPSGLGRPTAAESTGLGRPTTAESAPRSRRQRFTLPPAVEEHYVYEDEIATAGQANVLLCSSRETGERVAVKLYRQEGVVDARVLDSLAGGDARYVVPSVLGHGDGEEWEIMEYYPLGSLRRVMEERARAPFDPEVVRSFVAKTADALDYLHGRNVIHRDLKPDNVYVRSIEPLDTVIGDFGISVQSTGTIAATVRGSWAYAAPEASSATVTQAGDWWALGMMAYELLQGRHLLADRSTGLLPADDNMIRSRVGRGDFDLDAVSDDRWLLLLQGLLAVDSTRRWRNPQVQSWLSGGSPTVHRAVDARTGTIPGLKPYVIAERGYTDPGALADAMTEHWQESSKRLAGRGAQELGAFLRAQGLPEDEVVAIADRGSPSHVVLAMQRAFRPGRTPQFHGRGLDDASLEQTARAAAEGDAKAGNWLRQARQVQLLGELSSYMDDADRERLAVAGDRLTAWALEAEKWDAAFRREPEISAVIDGLSLRREGVLLLAALDADAARALRARAAAGVRRVGPLPAWASELADRCRGLAPDRSEGTGTAAVGDQVLDTASQIERKHRLAAEQAERDRLREQRAKDRAPRIKDVTGRFAGRFWAVAAVAAVAALGSTVSFFGWPAQFSWDIALRAAATGGGGILAVSLLVFLWERQIGYVRLAARGRLLASALVVSGALWVGFTFSDGAVRMPTDISWWMTPPLVLTCFFLLTVTLGELCSLRLDRAERAARRDAVTWVAERSPKPLETLAKWSVPVVALSGVVAVGHVLGAALSSANLTVQQFVVDDAPFPWIRDAAYWLDGNLPALGFPAGAGAEGLTVAVFCLGLTMQRLHRDLSRLNVPLAASALVVSLLLGLWLVLSSPWELVAMLSVAFVALLGIVIVAVAIWIISAMAS